MIGEALVALGAVLAALSALGVVRFTSLLQRMHALTKAATGSIVLALIGAALALRSATAVTTLLLALALQLFTFPVGSNLVAHAVYRRQRDADRRAVAHQGGEVDAATTDEPGKTHPS
jgi:multicomponent Na+:H+ antiporter subunit G